MICEELAVGVRPAQRDRPAGREACRSPSRPCRRPAPDAVAGPAEAGEIGAAARLRRQQAAPAANCRRCPSRWRSRTRSSIRAPLRLIEPCRLRRLDADARRLAQDVGAARIAARRVRRRARPAAAATGVRRLAVLDLGRAAGWRSGNICWRAKLQPSSTNADSTMARIMLRLSYKRSRSSESSGNRVVALAPPGVAAEDALQGKPAPAGGPIARKCGDRIGRAARLVAAARRQHLRRALLPAARDQDQQPGDHRRGSAERLRASRRASGRNRARCRLARPIRTWSAPAMPGPG